MPPPNSDIPQAALTLSAIAPLSAIVWLCPSCQWCHYHRDREKEAQVDQQEAVAVAPMAVAQALVMASVVAGSAVGLSAVVVAMILTAAGVAAMGRLCAELVWLH